MAKSCKLGDFNSNESKELRKIVGNDTIMYQNYMNTVLDGKNNYKLDFIEWLENKSLDISKMTAKQIAEQIVARYNHLNSSVYTDVPKDTYNAAYSSYGYTSLMTREEGILHSRNFMLLEYQRLQNSEEELKGNIREYYRSLLSKEYNRRIKAAILKNRNITEEEYIKELKTLVAGKSKHDAKVLMLDYFSKNLDLENVQHVNLLAVYKELNSSNESAKKYMDELLFTSNMQGIVNQIDKAENKRDSITEDDKNTSKAADANSENNNTINQENLNISSDSDPDVTITQYNNHIGAYTNFMTHIGERLKLYFDTLPKLLTPRATVSIRKNPKTKVVQEIYEYDVDTNNTYGIPNSMDASSCSTMLYGISYKFKDVPSMIDAIEEVAYSVKGFASFKKLANDCRTDYDFAYEVFTVFTKTIMQKIQVVSSDGNTRVRVSNARANVVEAMRLALINDVKDSVINADAEVIKGQIKELNNEIDKINKNIQKSKDKVRDEKERERYLDTAKKDIKSAKQTIIRLMRLYYGSLADTAIQAYIEIENNARGNIEIELKNIESLKLVIEKTNNAAEDSYNNYLAKEALKRDIIDYNRRLDNRKENKHWVNPEDYRSFSELEAIQILTTSQMTQLNQVVQAMLPYSIIPLQLNSPNVMGNNSSDVINNSYLTNLKKILDATRKEKIYNAKGVYIGDKLVNPALEEWGRKRLRQKSIKYNNILFQQIEDGNVISDGIFRPIYDEQGNAVNVEITENARFFLETALFDGSSDMDNGANITYNKMTTSDFLPSVYSAFFKTDQNAEFNSNYASGLAWYYLRTPSDAPKTFAVKGVRYDTSDLFVLKDKDAITNIINRIRTFLNDTPKVNITEYKQKFAGESYVSINSANDADLFVDYIFGEKLIYLDVDKRRALKVDEEDESTGYITFRVPNGPGIVVEGDIEKRGAVQVLSNIKIIGLASNSLDAEIDERLVSRILAKAKQDVAKKDIVVSGQIYNTPERIINKDSKLFTLFRNMFKAEMLDAAIALDRYFETSPTGWVKPTEKSKYEKEIKVKDGVSNTKGYKIYHLNANGKVLDVNDNGEYTLDGKVFHSNKFILTSWKTNEHGDEVAVVTNYLDKLVGIGESQSDRPIQFLYGGGRTNSFLHVIKNENNEVIDVYFTEAQQEAIDEAISKYLTDYINQTFDKVKQYENVIKGTEVNTQNVIDFAINYALTLNSYDDVFEGNSKYYLNGQTILKRAKEYQGSGIPYANTNFNDLNDYDTYTELENSYLNNGTYQGKTVQSYFEAYLKRNNAKPIKQTRAFRAVTIKNSVATNTRALKQLEKQLIDILVKQGFNKRAAANHAKDILYGPVVLDKEGNVVYEKGKPKRKGGFTETKVNDAQSYITFEEFVRRVAAKGQLKQYMPLFIKIMDENSVLTYSDLKQFIQVQKNFYYDLWYDEDYEQYVPRQIKNAEFVLVPRFIKGTQLETVYKLMTKAGIHQLNTEETSKAANEEVLTLWDDNGNLVGADTFVADANRVAKPYSYKYLYTQQETPQHVNSENKAGIQIVKKILDNIPPTHPMYHRKQDFFRVFVANIRDSYERLMQDLEVEYDANGNISKINNKVFYNKLKKEMLRLGVDSNLIDYVTLDENGRPLMPALFNNVLSRFESLAQSVFNNAITRQKLPGFHAAQVTNIGWRKLNQIVNKREYDGDLRYHPDGQPYIEIKLTASALGIDRNSEHYKNMTTAEIIAELEKKGLDKVIGYRIPTEGKQSVCIMKVVDLLDDAYGSTIVVPNDWVSQTGSDFDIDSIYGIQFTFYTDKKGELHKIEYLRSTREENGTINYSVSATDWYNYIKRYANRILEDGASTEVKEKFKEIKDKVSDILDSIDTQDLFDALSDDLQELIRKVDIELNADSRFTALTKAEQIEKRLLNKLNLISEYVKRDKSRYTANLKAYANILKEQLAFSRADAEEQVRGSNIFEKVILSKKAELEEICDEFNLFKYADFLNASLTNPELVNSRKARNNEILQCMLDILGDDSSLEENLSRSNFDDIIYWRNQIMNINVKIERDNRSSYNILDQIAYMEDAISGLALKGMSVALDTGCSVCNTAQAELTKPITIVYDEEDYDAKESTKRFKSDNNSRAKHVRDRQFVINHDKYGWSEDNRNIAGKIITSYSSQTTAHILDAIKEGAIPNVNQYTFTVYKTLVNIGSDYKTAISFIMQPGITRIVNNHNKNNSVFSKQYGNPIKQAIKDIAKELGIKVYTYTPISTVLDSIKEKDFGNGITGEQIFNSLFKLKDTDNDVKISLNLKANAKLPLIVRNQINRIKGTKLETISPVEGIDERVVQLIFDLGTIMQFNYINSVANQVGSVIRCLTSDKFGAKQTIFETNEIFNNILDVLYNDEYKIKRDAILVARNRKGEKVHLLEAIYPGVSKGTRENPTKGIVELDDVMDSVYPTLCAFLKYATVTSISVARHLFDTQHPNFVRAIREFSKVMSGYNPKIDEQTYKELEKYALIYLYNNIPQVAHPVVWDNEIKELTRVKEGNARIEDEEGNINENAIEENEEASQIDERARIYGFGYSPSINIRTVTKTEVDENGIAKKTYAYQPFDVVDINNPTDEEIKNYAKLSPAQKVRFIKTRFKNPGIFGFLDVTLYNDYNRGTKEGTQTIEYNESTMSSDRIYDEFKQMYYSNNPLIKLAAVDIIKYAIVVEGYTMTTRGVTKIISNDVIREEFGNTGFGFVNAIVDELFNLDTYNTMTSVNSINDIYESYLRSHTNTKAIKTLYLNGRTSSQYGLHKGAWGMIVSTPSTVSKDNKTVDELHDEWLEKLINAGIIDSNNSGTMNKLNEYIFIVSNNKKELYKIELVKNNIILYPLNSLEKNEVGIFSSRDDNNKYPAKNFYLTVINEFNHSKDTAVLDSNFIKTVEDTTKLAGVWNEYWQNKKKIDKTSIPAIPFNIYDEIAKGDNGLGMLLNTIISTFSSPLAPDSLYVTNQSLTNFIFSVPKFGLQNSLCSVQNITLPSNTTKSFYIAKVDISNYEDEYLSKKKGKYLKTNVELINDFDKLGKDNVQDKQKFETIKQVLLNARKANQRRVNNLFIVVPEEEPTTMAASLEEANYDMYNYMNVQRSNDNPNAVLGMHDFSHLGIDISNVKLQANTVDTVRTVAKYAKKETERLVGLYRRFERDPLNPDVYMSITDSRIQNLLEGNNALIEKYSKFVNDLNATLEKLKIYYEFNMESEDVTINSYLNDIKKSYKELLDLPLGEIRHNLAEGYVAKLSTNPLVKDATIKAYEGFFGTTGITWWFTDVAEAGNPLLQTIMNDVMGDIQAKINKGKRAIANHHKELRRIRKFAEEHGLDIDMDKVISNNELYQDYSKEFADKLETLYEKMTTEADRTHYGSIDHLKAKVEYDEFLAKHVNQEAKPEYYRNKVNMEKWMIEHHPEIYEEYMTTFYRLMDLRNYNTQSGVNEHIKTEIIKLEQKIRNLVSINGYYDDSGEWVTKVPYNNLAVKTYENFIMSSDEAAMLNRFVTAMRKLNQKYFYYDSVYGFDEQLKIHLQTVASFEKINPITGLPTIPQDVLEQNEQYREAKNWIRDNARYKLFQTEDSEGNPNSIGSKLNAAFKRLSLSSNGRKTSTNKLLKEKELYDEHGIPNPISLTEEEIRRIKEQQETNYQIDGLPRGTDRVLINSKLPSPIFTQAFYDKIGARGGTVNSSYLRLVTDLNKLLEPLLKDGVVHFDLIPDTEEGIELLNQIGDLYTAIRRTHKLVADDSDIETEDEEIIEEFRENECHEEVNIDAFEQQKNAARHKSAAYRAAFGRCNFQINKKGYFVRDSLGKPIPNKLLYTTIMPNDERYIDRRKTEDIELINKYYRRVPTKYYYQALHKAQDEGRYEEWFEDNHVYNPYSRRYEPIEVWIKQELRIELFEDTEFEGEWVPKNSQREKRVKDGIVRFEDEDGVITEEYDETQDMRNKDYKPEYGDLYNYHKGSDNGLYDNNVQLNEAEKMMADYLRNLLIATATTENSKRFFEKGNLPKLMNVNQALLKKIGVQVGKTVGIIPENDNQNKEWLEEVSYSSAVNREMPMTTMLKSEKMGSILKNPITKPTREGLTPEEYNIKYKEWLDKEKEIRENNKQVEDAIRDKDWFKVIDLYLEASAKYNAIEENKQKLFYLHQMLQNQRIYMLNHSLLGNTELAKNERASKNGNVEYVTRINDNLQKQYNTFLRRLLFDQWKKNDTKTATKFGNALQAFTSADYMMLNVRGGIANVTLGETSMWAEAIAGEYFDGKHLYRGHVEWNKGLIGFCRGLYEDRGMNLQDCIVKHFTVVDYDEQRGSAISELSLEKYAQRVRNAMFSPQTIGEHYMQNSVLFAMLYSHKIVAIENDPRQIGYTYMNKKEYIRYREAQLLETILTEEQAEKFQKFKDDIAKSKDEQALYAWWRKDMVTEFVGTTLFDDDLKRYNELKEANRKKINDEWENIEDMYDQLDMTEDGYLTFKPNTILEKLSREITYDDNLSEDDKAEAVWQLNNKITKADKLLGNFSERVRKVNNKIHGVYNRMGRAWCENYWFGSLVMQYHKHLPIGILKRYRTRGYWNEARGTVEKGSWTSMQDFLSFNARRVKAKYALTEDQVEAIEGVQALFKYTIDYITQLSTTWDLMPQYDKDNISRKLGDAIGVVAGVAIVVGLSLYDPEDDDAIPYNLALYEGDRLASEAFLYNPIGLWTETKTLMSTPVAGLSITNDVFNIMKYLASAILQGDDFDGTYQSGRFAGRDKLGVFIERRIPIWNGIRGFIDISENNRAYKIGQKPTSVASTITSWIRQAQD